jgi:2-amino-4-hydroxy-6-hydroxymethyldihydropteridine diphosphokinase
VAHGAVVYVGIGANLGDRLATIGEALRLIDALGDVGAISPIYESEPVGYLHQPAFLNGVARLETDLSPDKLLQRLHGIEQRLGRRRTFPNAPRTIDLDILFYGPCIIETPELTVPHPRLQERAFVLLPLSDIAPEFVHPLLGKSVDELLRALGPIQGVWRFDRG